jgi:hypothetical protein
MKILTITTTLAAAVLLTGCATSGYKQADKTGAGLAEFRAEIAKTQTAINETVTALDLVAQSANTDPRPAFEKFVKTVDRLESAAKTTAKRGQDMKAAGEAYFKQWEAQMASVQSEEIRKLAAERKAKLQETFSNIRKYSEPLKAQFDPWMSDLRDLQKYLSNDLTIAGVEAAKSLFVKATSEGTEVQKSMDALIAELNSVAAALTPAKVAPEPKKK